MPIPTRSRGRQAVLYWPAVAGAGAFAVLLVGGVIAGLASQRAARPAQAAAPTKYDVVAEALAVAPAPVAAPIPAAPAPDPAIPAVPRRRVDADEPPAHARKAEARPATGERYGTKVTFLCSPSDAAAEARRDGKLLFVLHLSGNFEDSRFT